jgi:hypothetical protein
LKRILGLPFCANPHKIKFTDGEWKCVELVVQNDFYNFLKLSNHDRVIDLEQFARFVEDVIPEGKYKTEHLHVTTHKAIIRKIAYGFDIHSTLPPSRLARRVIFRAYAHLFTQAQGTECANKDINKAALYGRSEATVSTRLAATSWLREQCLTTILGEKRVPWQGEFRLTEMLKQTKFVYAKVLTCKREIGDPEYQARLAEVIQKMKEPFTAGKLKKEARRDIIKVIDKAHKPSAKEKIQWDSLFSTDSRNPHIWQDTWQS